MTMVNITTNHEWAIRRILVALNNCANEQAIIEAAALLAQQLEAELAGLFVEDVNLLHLAELPFAREILGTHLQQRLFDMAQLRRSMQAEAERVRQALMRGAEQRRVNWSFLRTQGHLVAEMAMATESTDLLIVGRDCKSSIVGSAPAETIGRIVQQSHCSVLIAARQQGQHYQTVTVIAGSASDWMGSLRSAVALARMEQLPLRLLLITQKPDELEKLRQECEGRITDFPHGIMFGTFPSSVAVMAELSVARPTLLVLAYATLGSDDSVFKQLFESVNGPILIVR